MRDWGCLGGWSVLLNLTFFPLGFFFFYFPFSSYLLEFHFPLVKISSGLCLVCEKLFAHVCLVIFLSCIYVHESLCVFMHGAEKGAASKETAVRLCYAVNCVCVCLCVQLCPYLCSLAFADENRVTVLHLKGTVINEMNKRPWQQLDNTEEIKTAHIHKNCVGAGRHPIAKKIKVQKQP